jgi:hypothetical protein
MVLPLLVEPGVCAGDYKENITMGKLYLIVGAAAFLLVSVPAICGANAATVDTVMAELDGVLKTQREIIVLLDDEKSLSAGEGGVTVLR